MACLRHGDVRDHVRLYVAWVAGVANVVVGTVGAHDEVGAGPYGIVGDGAHALQPNGRCRAGHQAGRLHLLRRGQAKLSAAQEASQLDLVHLQVAAYGDEHHLAVAGVEDGLERLGSRDAQVHAQVLDGLHAGSVYLFQGQRLLVLQRRLHAFRAFRVGRVVAGGTVDEQVLSAFGWQQELVGLLAPNGSAVRLRHNGVQAAPAIDVAISLHHGVVAAVEPFLVGVEAVGVLHVEFTHADEAGAGPGLVAELRLDLVEDLRQVAIAVNVGLHREGDHLFVRGGHHQRALPAVLQPEERLAHGLRAAGGLPKLQRMERGHSQLVAARGVHLLPDDVLDLA